MNSLKELIKKYSDGKDAKSMEAVTDIIGDFLKNNVPEDAYCGLYKDIYSELVGGHYNKDFADEQIAKMYYTGKDGQKHYAPYWTEGEAREVYEKVKAQLPAGYNLFDFEVVLNMVKSDYCSLLEKWYNNEHPRPTTSATPAAATETDGSKADEYDASCKKWCADKMIDLAVNWLADEDNPFGNEKAWRYFNR